MSDYNDIPSAALDRAEMLEGILIAHATGGQGDNRTYTLLRRDFMSNQLTNLTKSQNLG